MKMKNEAMKGQKFAMESGEIVVDENGIIECHKDHVEIFAGMGFEEAKEDAKAVKKPKVKEESKVEPVSALPEAAPKRKWERSN
jgi:F0F1-type ATP synthase epsilon subunit